MKIAIPTLVHVVTILLFLLPLPLAAQQGDCFEPGNPAYNPPGSLEEPGDRSAAVEDMVFDDKTKSNCLLGIRVVFTNSGLGMLFGFKDGGVVDTRGIGTVRYVFCMYKSTDGHNWKVVKNPEITQLFSVTTYPGGLDALTPPLLASSDGNRIYLSQPRSEWNTPPWLYVTSNGMVWEKTALSDPDLAGANKIEFLNMSTPAMLVSYGAYGFSQGLVTNNGTGWKAYEDRSVLQEGKFFFVYSGREKKLHNFNGYRFAGLADPVYYYAPSDPSILRATDSPGHSGRCRPQSATMSKSDPNTIYADFGHLGLYRSNDGGKSFTRLAEWPGIAAYFVLYPVCEDGTVFLGVRDASGGSVYRSDDGGKTWSGVARVALNTVCEVDILPTGAAVLLSNTGAWRLKQGCKPAEAPPIVYGTTIITHGNLFHPPIARHYDTEVERLAYALLEKAGNGIIWVYDPATMDYREVRKLGRAAAGEQILLFDWAAESIIEGPGFTGAAAEALYRSLTKLKRQPFRLEKIHFIGHGRGCIVNALVVEHLRQLDPSITIDQVTNLGPYEADYDLDDSHPDFVFGPANAPANGVIAWDGIYSDTYWQANGKQVTTGLLSAAGAELIGQCADQLDKLPAVKAPVFSDMAREIRRLEREVMQKNDANEIRELLFDVISELKKIPNDDIRLVAKRFGWIGLILTLQDMVDAYLKSNVNSRAVRGSENFEWARHRDATVIHLSPTEADPLFNFTGICDVYIDHIKNALPGKCSYGPGAAQGGFCHTRLNAGEGHRTLQKGQALPSKPDIYKNFIYVDAVRDLNISRVRNIFNGSFDRVYEPFWSTVAAAGWDILPQPNAPLLDNKANFTRGALWLFYNPDRNSDPAIARHDPCLVPSDAAALTFRLATQNLDRGRLTATIRAVDAGLSPLIQTFDLPALPVFTEYSLDVAPFRGKVVTVEFAFGPCSKDPEPNGLPVFGLDEVQYSRRPANAPALPPATAPTSPQAPAATVVTPPIAVATTTANVSQATSNTVLMQLSDADGWKASEGTVSFGTSMMALQPRSTGKPAVLRRRSFQLPIAARSLRFKVAALSAGDLSIAITEPASGRSDAVQTEHLAATLSPGAPEFKTISVDLQAYAGRVIVIELRYQSAQGKEAKLLFDTMEIRG